MASLALNENERPRVMHSDMQIVSYDFSPTMVTYCKFVTRVCYLSSLILAVALQLPFMASSDFF